MGQEQPTDWADLARGIIDEADYMTLATADGDGKPWASPVWFAPAGYREFLWISRPETRHSCNLADRREVGIVVFDSRSPIGTGKGTYIEGVAEAVPEGELERCVGIFAQRSRERSGPGLAVEDVTGSAPLRMYRALATSHSITGDTDQRVPVDLA